MNTNEFFDMKQKVKTFEETLKKVTDLELQKTMLVDKNFKEFNIHTPHNSSFKLRLSMLMRDYLVKAVDAEIEALKQQLEEI